MHTLGFLGFGQMAAAMADGWRHADLQEQWTFYASAAHPNALKKRASAHGVIALPDNAALVASSDIIIIAVKPYLVRNLLEPLKDALKGKIIVSIAADLSYQDYRNFLSDETHVWSTLPNTPMAIGHGVLVAEAETNLQTEELELVTNLFRSIAQIITVPAEKKSIAGTLSGCGPAFISLAIEALADAGVKYGLPRQTAYQLVSSMIEGTAALQQATQTHPGIMKDQVTSPGGTTIRGICALEEYGFRNALIKAVDAIEGGE